MSIHRLFLDAYLHFNVSLIVFFSVCSKHVLQAWFSQYKVKLLFFNDFLCACLPITCLEIKYVQKAASFEATSVYTIKESKYNYSIKINYLHVCIDNYLDQQGK
jgi:hypothetical protein